MYINEISIGLVKIVLVMILIWFLKGFLFKFELYEVFLCVIFMYEI